MKTLISHINYYLSEFLDYKDEDFDRTFSKMCHSKKNNYKSLLKYVNRVLYFEDESSTNKIHLHLDCIDKILVKVLGEFLLIREHYFNARIDILQESVNTDLEKEKHSLVKIKSKLQHCPTGATAKNGGNRAYKKWKKERTSNKIKLDFIDSLNDKSSLNPKCLFNSLVSLNNSFSDFIQESNLTANVDSDKSYYLISNSDLSLEDIDRKNSQLVDELQSIILFNCERKTVMKNYNFKEIEKWNNEFETNFKRYIIVTFTKNHISNNNLLNRLKLVKERFFLSEHENYTLSKFEYDTLISSDLDARIDIEFTGNKSSVFWEDFQFLSKTNSIYELRSLKLKNIYSLCFNY